MSASPIPDRDSFKRPDPISNLTNVAGTWGKFIPTFWGNVRLAGYQVWASKFYNVFTYRDEESVQFTSNGMPFYGKRTTKVTYTSYAVDAAYSFGYNGLGRKVIVRNIRHNQEVVYSSAEELTQNFKMNIRYGDEDFADPFMLAKQEEDKPVVYYPGQLVVVYSELKTGEMPGINDTPLPEAIDITVASEYTSGVNGERVEIESDNEFYSTADSYHPDYKKKCWYRYRQNEGDRGVIEKWDMETYELLGTVVPTIDTPSGWTTQKLVLIYLPEMQLFYAQHKGPEGSTAFAAIYLLNPDTGATVTKYGETGYTFSTPKGEGISYLNYTEVVKEDATSATLFGIINDAPSNTYRILITSEGEDGKKIVAEKFTGPTGEAPFRIPDASARGRDGYAYCRKGQQIYKINGLQMLPHFNIPISGDDGIDNTAQPLYFMSTVGEDLVFAHGFRLFRFNPDGTRAYLETFDDPDADTPSHGISYFQANANVSAIKARRELGITTAGYWGPVKSYIIDWDAATVAFVTVTVSPATTIATKGTGFFWDSEVGKLRDIERGANTSNAILQLPFTEYGGKILLRDFLRSLYVNTGRYTEDQIEFINIDDMITGALMIKGYELDIIVQDTCRLFSIEILEGYDFIRFYRNRPIVGESDIDYDIDIDQLALVQDGGDERAAIVTTISDPEKLVAEIELKFIDPEADYNENSVTWRRSDAAADATNKATFTTIIIMTKGEALTLLQNKYTDTITSATTHEIMLPISFSDVYKGNIIRVKHNGFTDVMKVDETQLNANHSVRCVCDSIVLDRGSIIEIPDTTNTDIGLDLGQGQTIAVPLDISSIHHTHNFMDGFAYYYAGYSDNPNWKGGYVTRRTYNEGEGRLFDVFNDVKIAVYKAKSVLSNKRWVVDTDPLQVEMIGGNWDTAKNGTVDDLLANSKRNICIYGAPGRWEIMQIASVVDGVATGIIRGLRGTEQYCGLHEIDDKVYLIDTALIYEKRDFDYITRTDVIKGVSFWEKFASKTGTNVVVNGASLMPFAPYYIKAVEDAGSGDVTVTWLRRDRSAPNVLAGEAPMIEDDEVYEIDIIIDNEVVRTVKGITEPTWVYTIEDRETDGTDEAPTLHLKIYQISAVIGRGFPGECVANV